jgi:hypothetical protein
LNVELNLELNVGPCPVESPYGRRDSQSLPRDPSAWRRRHGRVYEAEDTRLHRKVALKVLPTAVASGPERRQRFEREAQAIAALSHPNIVTIYSVEEAPSTSSGQAAVPFLTMELVEGTTLGELIPTGGLPLERVLRIGGAVADAIAAAQQKGITHRDLKPVDSPSDSFSLGVILHQYPGGTPTRITNDLTNYTSVSLSADSRSLATVQSDMPSDVWVMPAGDTARAKPITAGSRSRGGGRQRTWSCWRRRGNERPAEAGHYRKTNGTLPEHVRRTSVAADVGSSGRR